MTEMVKKKKPWLKRILIAFLAIVIVFAGVYWYVATETFSDTKSRKADYTVNALEFIHEFQQDLKAANAKYTDKIQIINHTLFIHTNVGPLKQELMYQKEKIIERVNEALGEKVIKEVVIQ